MRRSSKGNPNHWPAGSPKGGQFAPKGMGVVYAYAQEYYTAKTKYRNGEISKEELEQAKRYYSDKTAEDAPTPKQKRFAEAISKRLGIELPGETKKEYSEFIAANVDEFYKKKPQRKKPVSVPTGSAASASPEMKMPVSVGRGKEGAIAFTKECAAAFGVNSENVTFHTKTNGRAEGQVKSCIINGRVAVLSIAVESKRDKNSQIHNTYHEVFHLAQNGCEIRDHRERDAAMEEVAADVSAYTMCRYNGIEVHSYAYSMEIIQILPRLKKNSEKYKDCKTMSDFGRIFIADRKAGKTLFTEEVRAYRNGRFSEGKYYAQYNAEKHFDAAYERLVRPCDKSDSFKQLLKDDFKEGWERLKSGKSLQALSSNQKIMISACLRRAMEEDGIL